MPKLNSETAANAATKKLRLIMVSSLVALILVTL
jgi:hypothetical protein